ATAGRGDGMTVMERFGSPRRILPAGDQTSRRGFRARAGGSPDALRYGTRGTSRASGEPANGSGPVRQRAIGSAGERLVHTEEVTGSIPVSPTDVKPVQTLRRQLSSYAEELLPSWEEFGRSSSS